MCVDCSGNCFACIVYEEMSIVDYLVKYDNSRNLSIQIIKVGKKNKGAHHDNRNDQEQGG